MTDPRVFGAVLLFGLPERGIKFPVAIRVIDDGPGVPKELRRTLFEPGTTTKRGGWGIGLALSRRVVEDAHGGALMLEPTEKGTCFVMRLPLAARTP